MAHELTNEEIVTRILTNSEIIKSNSQNLSIPRNGGGLGEYLKTLPKNEPIEVNKGKYTFINLNSGWNFK